jgi:glycerol kinase
VAETTSLGAAFAAGLACGFWGDLDELKRVLGDGETFEPRMVGAERERLYDGWKSAVQCSLSWANSQVA